MFLAISRLPLGVGDRRIGDDGLSASSSWDRYHGAMRGRLYICRSGRFIGAWSAKRNTRGQWLQVTTSKEAIIRDANIEYVVVLHTAKPLQVVSVKQML